MKIYLRRVHVNENERTIKALIDRKCVKISELQTKLYCEQQLFNGRYEKYCPVETTDSLVVIPRFAYHELGDKVELINTIKFNNTIVNNGNAKIEIWPENRKLINKIYARLVAINGLIIKLDTGYGKTVIASEIIRMVSMKTVIVVKNSDLQTQMYNDLLANLNIDSNLVALKGGKTIRPQIPETQILICIINSVRKCDVEFWNDFGLAIFDECHAYCSKENSNIFKQCQLQYMLGLSANPEKPWNANVVKYHIGPIMDCDEITAKKSICGKVYVIKYNGPPEYTRIICNENSKVMSVAKMIKQFMEDEERNKLIVSTIKHAVDNYGYGFVFAMRNDFLQIIAEMFARKYPEITYSILNADTRVDDKIRAREESQIIFTNYSYSEGINIKRMLFIVHASPYKCNGKQITGRTLRGDLNDARAIYDIVDEQTPLKKQFVTRSKNYELRKYEIIENFDPTIN
jgi:superfamily II DNA or RNA helicase